MTARTAGPLNERYEVLGILLFVFAGCGFVVLSALAGTATIMASGVPAVVPVAWNGQSLVVAGAAWWMGLAAALAGLAIWIIRAKAKRTLLPWAIVDCALMAVLIVVVWLFAL
ncbi:hypothetical protein [Salinibacterium sp. UTAS2018]|uniref:hypothetical protein n=1 Tax=Salinibacterium sp. UTAS2018 TaxID=2508880 RepID=UPI00143DE2F7|nr:hypothetical protein [Salinibacterium sp. UTAS2018]